MKESHFGSHKKKHTDKELKIAEIAAFVAAALACITLSLTAYDAEKYPSKDEAVSCAITYSAPKKTEEAGFWDLFSQSVARLFELEG